MAASNTITGAFEKLPDGRSSFQCRRAHWRGGRGGEVATLFFYPFLCCSCFPFSSFSFLGSDGILSKRDQGRALILRATIWEESLSLQKDEAVFGKLGKHSAPKEPTELKGVACFSTVRRFQMRGSVGNLHDSTHVIMAAHDPLEETHLGCLLLGLI